MERFGLNPFFIGPSVRANVILWKNIGHYPFDLNNMTAAQVYILSIALSPPEDEEPITSPERARDFIDMIARK